MRTKSMAAEYVEMNDESDQSAICITDANIRLFLLKSTMVDTVLPADSLEFCPSPGFHEIFVCGTYKLEDQVSTRRGLCLVFKILLDAEEPLSWCAFLQPNPFTC